MPTRRTIRPSETVYTDLKDEKEEWGMTWDEYLTRLQTEGGVEVHLSADSINDIADAVSRRVETAIDDALANGNSGRGGMR